MNKHDPYESIDDEIFWLKQMKKSFERKVKALEGSEENRTEYLLTKSYVHELEDRLKELEAKKRRSQFKVIRSDDT